MKNLRTFYNSRGVKRNGSFVLRLGQGRVAWHKNNSTYILMM
jgi:hypothetical protein